MPRPVLDESRIHPAIRDKIAGHHADIVAEVERPRSPRTTWSSSG